MSLFAQRMAHIAPFHVMSLLAEAKAMEASGLDVIHMEIGEPDFATPEPIVAAGIKALQRGDTRYSTAKGLPQLREAIAAHYAHRYGVQLPAERIVLTPGASGALLLALGVLLNRDDEVLLADPTYPCNRHFISMFEAGPRAIPVGPEQRYQPEVAQVEQYWTARTRALLLATPANPTGTTIGLEQLRALASVVANRGGALLVDEIYQGLVYNSPDHTVLEATADSFVINSFSKYFQMTGWRLGWLVAPESHIEQVEKLAMNVFLAAPTPAQYAALAAFDPATLEILDARRQEMQRRRDFLLPALRQIGLRVPAEPDGAFYIYADCSALCTDSQEFARDLLLQAHVAVTPGLDFGSNQPQRYIRIAYTADLQRLHQAVERIHAFIASRR